MKQRGYDVHVLSLFREFVEACQMNYPFSHLISVRVQEHFTESDHAPQEINERIAEGIHHALIIEEPQS